MSRAYNYCNNCGESGHQFHHCKKPITSIGVIAFRINDEGEREYLMIRRKDTLGFVDFIRGKYPINNRVYLSNILSEMTCDERERLRNQEFDQLWAELWGGNIGIQYRGEEKTSRDKMECLRAGVPAAGGSYSLDSLLDEVETSWGEPEWGFPKGRRNYQEKDLSCALRECEEETGIKRSEFRVIQNLLPLEETFTGSNFKSYKHRYFVAQYCPGVPPDPPSPFQATEVSAVRWMGLHEALGAIRPYNAEKQAVLVRANRVLDNYRLCW